MSEKRNTVARYEVAYCLGFGENRSQRFPVILVNGKIIWSQKLVSTEFGGLVIETDHKVPLRIAMLTGVYGSMNDICAGRVLANCILGLDGILSCDQKIVDSLHVLFSEAVDGKDAAAMMCFLNFDLLVTKIITAGLYSCWLFRSRCREPEQIVVSSDKWWSDSVISRSRRPTIGVSGDIDTRPCWSLAELPNDVDCDWLIASHATLELVPLNLLRKYYDREGLSVEEQLKVFWELMLLGITPLDPYGLILIRRLKTFAPV